MAYDQNDVVWAPLHDTGDLIPDADLFANGGVSQDKATGIITLVAEKLMYHKNGAGAMGYWIGIGAVIPAETVYTEIKYAWDGNALASAGMTGPDFIVEGVEYIGVYINAGIVPFERKLVLSFDNGATEFEYTLDARLVERNTTILPDVVTGAWITAFMATMPQSVQDRYAGLQLDQGITIDVDGTIPLRSKEMEIVQLSR